MGEPIIDPAPPGDATLHARARDARLAQLERLVARQKDEIRDLRRGWARRTLSALGHAAKQGLDSILAAGFVHRPGTLVQHRPRPLIPEAFPVRRTPDADLPRISITTPSYMQGAFLERTMRSVLDQGYPSLEYSVFDGGSTDDSPAIIRRYAPQLAAWRSEKDGGQAAAIRDGLARATGDVLAWLNSDDMLLPGALRFVGDYFARHPEVDAVYGHRIVIDPDDREVGRWILPRHTPEFLRWFDHIPQETLFWRKNLYARVGGVNPTFHFAVDWDLLLRFQDAGARIVRLPYFIGCFRTHDLQKTRGEIATRGREEMAAIRRRVHGRDIHKREFRNLRRRELRLSALTWRALQLGIRI